MSLLDEFIEASTPVTPKCGAGKVLDFLDDVDPDRAEVLRAALADRNRVTASAIETVVKRWDLEGAPDVAAQSYQRHRRGSCSCGD